MEMSWSLLKGINKTTNTMEEKLFHNKNKLTFNISLVHKNLIREFNSQVGWWNAFMLRSTLHRIKLVFTFAYIG